MVIVYGKIKDKKQVKQKSKRKITCPFCQEEITIGIEITILKNINSSFYSPHIHLHGDSLHALICYVNKDLKVRNIGVIKSIEISRNSETFNQLMKKWTNPY